MSPRPYRMAGRRHGVEATRRRIVETAMRLHSQRGAIATSWEAIAAEAGVARATVYHHFPSLDELVPACAQVAFELSQIPTPARATAMFAHLPSPTVRLSYFIGETCRCYAAGADWLRAAWRERDLVPAMEQSVARFQQALRVLLDSVLVGLDLSVDQHRLLSTLLDFPFWESLDRSGMARARIPDHIEQLALTALAGAPTGGLRN